VRSAGAGTTSFLPLARSTRTDSSGSRALFVPIGVVFVPLGGGVAVVPVGAGTLFVAFVFVGEVVVRAVFVVFEVFCVLVFEAEVLLVDVVVRGAVDVRDVVLFDEELAAGFGAGFGAGGGEDFGADLTPVPTAGVGCTSQSIANHEDLWPHSSVVPRATHEPRCTAHVCSAPAAMFSSPRVRPWTR
jgi:hypothetical protein